MSDAEPAEAFVDTNVWLYALLRTDPAKQATAAALIRRVRPVISVQVVNETCVNLIRKAGFDHGRIRRVVRGLYARCRVVTPDRELLLDAVDLRSLHSLSYWDSLVVAAAYRSGVGVLYSEDLQDGLTIRGRLRIENPFRP